MPAFDYGTVSEEDDLIPDETILDFEMTIKAGNIGEDGLLSRSKNGEAEGLAATFTVIKEGTYFKRKIFSFMVLSGTTEGHAQAGDITKKRLRAILESARGVKPTDVSEEAKEKRIAEHSDFGGICFVAKVGIEPAKGQYKAKNVIASIVTPEKDGWHQLNQSSRAPTPSSSSSPPPVSGNSGNKTIVTPDWAR
jgi:hypothetical protein